MVASRHFWLKLGEREKEEIIHKGLFYFAAFVGVLVTSSCFFISFCHDLPYLYNKTYLLIPFYYFYVLMIYDDCLSGYVFALLPKTGIFHGKGNHHALS